MAARWRKGERGGGEQGKRRGREGGRRRRRSAKKLFVQGLWLTFSDNAGKTKKAQTEETTEETPATKEVEMDFS